MEILVKDIAQLVNGTVVGDPNLRINRPSRIEEGGAGSITFFGNPKYESFVYSTTASAILAPEDFEPRKAVAATLIKVKDVYAAVTSLMENFAQTLAPAPTGISDRAVVHESARIGQQVYIGPLCVVEEGAVIADGARLHAQVYVGRGARIGSQAILYPGVRVLDACIIGDRCILHANAVIGGDGFGFALQPDGSYKKIPQIGNVVLEADVEVGAGATIDRASMGSTLIRRGAKLDNLIQVAHNVEIGAHTVIAALTGIAGSAKIGSHCQIGGQVGIAGHTKIADQTKIQAQAGIISDIDEPDTIIVGSPAIPFREYFRSFAVFRQLPDLHRRLLQVEKLLKTLGSK
jgi:UDP-3-O-[3-hydroxymyristoyl] glucosamine N-acyltransferase